MAIINRKSGMVRGTIGGEVYYSSRGRQAVRSLPTQTPRKNTPPWVERKAVFGELAKLWRELPDNVKTQWNSYAAEQGDASDMDTNENVTYRYCPIPHYPPRPKHLDGRNAFEGANALAHAAGMDIPRLMPPMGVAIHQPATINCGYDRASGKLIIGLTTPNLIEPEKADAVKALVYITIGTSRQLLNYQTQTNGGVLIVSRRKLDAFDIPRTAGAKIERRYSVIEYTHRCYGYKPFCFKDLPYVRVYLGAQVVVARDSECTPIVSNGTFAMKWIFNDTRYLPYEEMFQTGQLQYPGKIKFGAAFDKHLRELRDKLGKKEFADYGKSRAD